MTDIVVRLKDHYAAKDTDAWMDCIEAADEIERLRQVLENIQQARVLQGKAIIDAGNEIERLKDGEARLRAALEGAAVQFANNNLPAFSHQCRAALEER